MKKLLFFLLFPFSAFGANVITDPVDNRTTHCGVFLDGDPKIVVPVTAAGVGKICKYDVSGVDVGTHIISMTAIVVDPVWGDGESPQSVPLSFVRPDNAVAAPSITGVVP